MDRSEVPGKGSVVVVNDVPVGLRVAKDGSALRVPLVLDEYGSPVGMLCEQIGCRVVQLVTLAGGLELWLDEEAWVFLDTDDRTAVAAAVNPVATMIAGRTARLRVPVLGVAVSWAVMARTAPVCQGSSWANWSDWWRCRPSSWSAPRRWPHTRVGATDGAASDDQGGEHLQRWA